MRNWRKGRWLDRSVMGEVDRSARGQLLWPLMGTVRGWDWDPRVVGSHGRFLIRERPELVVFRYSPLHGGQATRHGPKLCLQFGY